MLKWQQRTAQRKTDIYNNVYFAYINNITGDNMTIAWYKQVAAIATHPHLLRPPLIAKVIRDTEHFDAGDIVAGVYTVIGTVQVAPTVFIPASEVEMALQQKYLVETDTSVLYNMIEDDDKQHELTLELTMESFKNIVLAAKGCDAREFLSKFNPQNINQEVAGYIFGAIHRIPVSITRKHSLSTDTLLSYLPDFVELKKEVEST